MNITVDEGFSVDFNTKEDNFNAANTFIGCNVCGEDHETEKCSIFDNFVHVEDTKVLPRALLTLPPNLKVETLSDGTKAVIATECFTKGTQFGPYQAEKFYSMNPFDDFPIKIFGDTENILPDLYVDSRNEEKCNWMCYVPEANNFEEQNLICYQIKLDIFYSVIRDINPGDHLKVWYSIHYAEKIGSKVHVAKEDECVKIQKVAEKLPAKKLGAQEKQNWCCKMCGHSETNVVRFAKHLQKHYWKMLNHLFVCNICNAGFSTEKGLNAHRKHKHKVCTDHKSNLENIANKPELEVPKTDLIEPCMPLSIDNFMSVTLTESDQLLMLDQLSLPNTGMYNDLSDAETLRAILCDDNTKASKTAQENSIADFSLELVESNDTIPKLQSPYYCDICNKLFYSLQYLFRHLKKHTGEYTCVQCLVVFTRRENYLRHPCFTTNTVKKFNCSYCSKYFYQKKYLKRHITRHFEKCPCDACGKQFKTKSEKDKHNCSLLHPKKLFPCGQCDRKFELDIYLQRHIKRCHKDQITKQTEQPLICEICAKIYRSSRALTVHKMQHLEPNFECKICDKKFYRIDLYNNHIVRHGTEREVCDICNKKFKSKKSLKEHKQLHHNRILRFSCEHCAKKYKYKSGLRDHQQKMHTEDPVDCPECDKTFKNNFLLKEHKNTVHSSSIYKCSVCDKIFPLNRLLNRHMKYYHSDIVHSCIYCFKTFKVLYGLRNHLKRRHSEYKNQWENSEKIICSTVNKNIINENVKISRQRKNNTEEDTEVLLTIPETDQDLGKSVYILENGTIETSTPMETNSAAQLIEQNEVLLSVPETDQNLEQNLYILKNVSLENSSLEPISFTKSDENVPTSNLLLLSNAESIPTISSSETVENTNILLHVPETEQITNLTDTIQNLPASELLLSVSETDQQITLGKNAYILEDGTIVQPQEQGNLMIYIINQQLNV